MIFMFYNNVKSKLLFSFQKKSKLMQIKNIAYFLFFVLISSCSTSINNSKNSGKQLDTKLTQLKRKDDIDKIKISSDVSVEGPQGNLSFSSSINLAKKDSASFTFYGPFGIQAGKLYINTEKFKMYNMFKNELITGTPSKENLNKVAQINLNYSDLFHFLRSEIPGNIEKYYIVDDYKNEKNYLFKNASEKTFVEFILIDKTTGNIQQYQQKNAQGEMLLNAFFDEYKEINKKQFAQKITIKFPLNNSSVIFQFSDFELVQKFENSFDFQTPSSVEKIDLNVN